MLTSSPRCRANVRAAALLVLSFALPLLARSAHAGTQPKANEAILFEREGFQGPSSTLSLPPTVLQAVAVLKGQATFRNFRSIRVGKDIVASLYEPTKGGEVESGVNRLLAKGDVTRIEAKYAIVVLNRRADSGRADYVDLPFRVSVFAQWKSTFGPGHVHAEDFFVPPTPRHRSCFRLGRVLQPADQGADSFQRYTGKYPPGVIEVTFYGQDGCQGRQRRFAGGSGARDPGASLWDHGFGDKARSIRLIWKGRMPSIQRPNPPPQRIKPDVSGEWVTRPDGATYHFRQSNDAYQWVRPGTPEHGTAKIDYDQKIQVEAKTTYGTVRFAGRVAATDRMGRATRMEWNAPGRRLVFVRPDSRTAPPAPGPRPSPGPIARIPDLAGRWVSSLGHEYVIVQTGTKFQWTQTEMKEKTRGRIEQGKRIRIWVLNPLLGSKEVEMTGTIEQVDAQGKARRISLSIGVTMKRK